MSSLRTVNNLCTNKLTELELSSTVFNKEILCSSFIAGGAIVSTAKDEHVKDYDLFFTTTKAATAVFNTLIQRIGVGSYFKLQFDVDPINPNLQRGRLVLARETQVSIEDLIEEFNDTVKKLKGNKRVKVYPCYLSKNALTLTNGVQLIFRFIGEPKEVFTTFDYEHCKVYWRPNPLGLLLGSVYYEGRSQESLAKNELIYTGHTRFVLSAISRLNKFIKRGWGVSPSSLLSLAVSASKVDWSDPAALEEELLGIYGIESKTLKTILGMCSENNKIDLDKIVQVLGEV